MLGEKTWHFNGMEESLAKKYGTLSMQTFRITRIWANYNDVNRGHPNKVNRRQPRSSVDFSGSCKGWAWDYIRTISGI